MNGKTQPPALAGNQRVNASAGGLETRRGSSMGIDVSAPGGWFPFVGVAAGRCLLVKISQ